jgi:hypothetical protein
MHFKDFINLFVKKNILDSHPFKISEILVHSFYFICDLYISRTISISFWILKK